MFNTYHSHTDRSTRVTEQVTKEVNVHNAPLAEQVRLLNEMQEKAEENIIASLRVDSNEIKLQSVFLYNNPLQHGVKWMCKFSLNGTVHEIKGFIDLYEIGNDWQPILQRSAYMSQRELQLAFINQIHKIYVDEVAKILAIQSADEFWKKLVLNTNQL